VYSAVTVSPTLIWSKFLTSGGATMSMTLPFGPLSVMPRVLASMATTMAETREMRAAPAWPGALAASTTVSAGLAWE